MEDCSSTYNEEPSTYEWSPIPETDLSKVTSRLAVIDLQTHFLQSAFWERIAT